ncbi:MFS general substrate transporter [Pleomassaria siparia CBS 279.74]|uniref:MFS general substrate transporter n=1 Tax=Pleomassaria siparia CBS 279.74 TaxID=1314801 RepID=A0A6G1KCH6_9PLEO|nr:MFS general substrate transporter [Pleomassaria siparia CBS 279.74]
MVNTSAEVEECPVTSYSPSAIERLGRERPEAFKSIWVEIGFCLSLLGSMFVSEYLISGFNLILPALSVALQIPPQAQTWPASVFSLVTGAFLLPFGRLADMYGGYIIFIVGLVWLLVWTLIAGFSRNYIMFILCRALQGLGAAAFLPSGIMLMGIYYRPGPRKNLVFGLYGALAPAGFFAGVFFAGVSVQLITWEWFFFIGSIILAIVVVVSYLTVPYDRKVKGATGVKMDWLGTMTIVPALVLIVFALTEGSHAPRGWTTPYILVTFLLGFLFLGGFVYVEGWVADQPLLPGDIFNVKGMKALALALFFQYGNFGMFLFYASFYIEKILHAGPLLASAWFSPMAIGGLFFATMGGMILHILPGTILLLLSGTCFILSTLLFAIIPSNPTYWAYVFPAMICASAGIDITFNVTNVFITTSMPKARQGLAGSLINSLLFLGISFFLGFADLSVTMTADRGEGQSYKVAFWFATGCAVFGMAVMFLGVKIGKASSDLTVEEREELERELALRQSS